ncbi:MAG: glutamine--fructose-6-phosphate transaminase (isomerizing) [Clostridiales bacterium]|nr:glutamine--fructose-6-phosphate transaminase (isomerizing) [Clostridiales bacterium]
MCGIVGYVGNKNAIPVLVDGLKKLEYRGYDSAGIAINAGDKLIVAKTKGRLVNLETKIKEDDLQPSHIGIGHTRWATHGAPSDVNSHPHMSTNKEIAVVHNGIIENYIELKQMLVSKGYKFLSETDTEVIAHLAEMYYTGDLVETLLKVVKDLRGSYAIGLVHKGHPDEFVAIRKNSPLIVGLGENENFIASDIPAILEYTRKVYLLDDNQLAKLTKDSVELFDVNGNKVQKDVYNVEWDVEAAEKGGYEHFMQKEINEQPKVVNDTIAPRILNGEIKFEDFSVNKEQLENINKIYIVACGTAYHAGMVGKYLIESIARIPVEVDIASEFRYRNPIIDEHTLVIIVSQSGETADTLAALREAKECGGKTLAIVNVVGSSIAREADNVIYTWAGPEIAVASTKAYTTQLSVMYLLAIYFGKIAEKISDEESKKLIAELLEIPEKLKALMKKEDELKRLATKYSKETDIFYLGRGLDYVVAMEGSLKLKEISYIHSEAYASGELKHGTIALIEHGTVVFALATQEELLEKSISNIKEVKARGASVIAIAQEGNEQIKEVSDHVLYIPKTDSRLASILTVVPLQMFAYHCATAKCCDVDKPRNLAKSVTVE